MSYEQARDNAQLIELDIAIDTFIANYRAATPPQGERQTVILFPGGTGSELKRTRKTYDEQPDPAAFEYDTVWLNCHTFIGAALLLRMKRSGATWVDADGHIIIAGGSVSFLGRTPYDGFQRWCASRNIDVLVYGYDWRRPFDEVADFFVQGFLPRFRTRVQQAHGVDPLQTYSLVGHSQGGMLVNWLLRRHGSSGALPAFKRAITAASPFYGYGGQLDRWFAGMSLLNGLGERNIVQVISSLPALYALNFLSRRTYAANKEAFGRDTYPLAGYPSHDIETGVDADPYYPESNGPLVRYPSNEITGFDPRELKNGARISAAMSNPLDPALAARFYNVRGVLDRGKTAGSARWKWIDPSYDPDSEPSPIELDEDVPGDGTQPAWTARLLRADPAEAKSHVIDVVAGDAEHAFLMESDALQNALAPLLAVPKLKRGESFGTAPAVNVTSFDTLKAVHAMQQEFQPFRGDVFSVSDKQLADFWLKERATDKTLLEQIARRIHIDLSRPETATRRDRERTIAQREKDAMEIVQGWRR